MKKIFALVAVLVVFMQLGLKAQFDTDVVNFNLVMSAVIDVTVTDDPNHIITINTSALWNNGAIEGAGIADGVNTVTVDATGNWNMQISAPDFSDGTNTVPINNLGVYCTAEGTNGFGTASTCNNTTPATALGLANGVQDLILNNGGNAGDATANTFTFHWEFGTMHGTMNGTSLMNQLVGGFINLGTYNTTATLTATLL